MKISAINSNYEMKNSLKKNVAVQNTNMATPSFEGLNKINKVSAKKLAVALMASIAVTTPALQSCATSKNIVDIYPIKKDTIDDFYVNPKITEKYPNINPEEHKNFDLVRNPWMGAVQFDTLGFDSPLRNLGDSLDAQLLNYYMQNPEEKSLPNEAMIQDFVDNYNKTSQYGKEADIYQAKQIIKQYKAVASKYKITEQEAVWNLPSMNRFCYQSWSGTSQDEYFKDNGKFMKPSSLNRQDFMDYTQYVLDNIDDVKTEGFVENWTKGYSPEVMDEIHERIINTEIHERMLSPFKSKGSDYGKYVEPQKTQEEKDLAKAKLIAANKATTKNTETKEVKIVSIPSTESSAKASQNSNIVKEEKPQNVQTATKANVETPKATSEVSPKKIETPQKETKTQTPTSNTKENAKVSEPDYKVLYEVYKAQVEAEKAATDAKKSNEPDYKAMYEDLKAQKSSEQDYKKMYEDLKAQMEAENKKAKNEVKKSNEPDYKKMYEELKAKMDAESKTAPAQPKTVGKPISSTELKAFGFTNRNIIKDCSILLTLEAQGYDISEYKEKLAGRISRLSETDQAWVYKQPEYKTMFGN